ncbi:MAG TPA: hypothetical protein VD929_07085 [Caulobacteraceae bacterium]|nr:hypothetical protein [Caulobacteraceae bacterium]
MNLEFLKRRLGWFGAAWLGTFVLVLAGLLGATLLFGTELVSAADLLLRLALAALGLGTAAAVVQALVSREGFVTKAAVVLLAVVLVLPLLWSPVLASVLAAWAAKVPIEYSTVYAGFRVTVSQMLYPIGALFSGEIAQAVWELFQGAATLVGFLASAAQLWTFSRRFGGAQGAAA